MGDIKVRKNHIRRGLNLARAIVRRLSEDRFIKEECLFEYKLVMWKVTFEKKEGKLTVTIERE